MVEGKAKFHSTTPYEYAPCANHESAAGADGKTDFFPKNKTSLPNRISKPLGINKIWLRGVDLNHRPLGYEPNELPDCSTPQFDHSNRSGVRQTARPTRTRRWPTHSSSLCEMLLRWQVSVKEKARAIWLPGLVGDDVCLVMTLVYCTVNVSAEVTWCAVPFAVPVRVTL